jgi:hypothetical protein
MADDAVLVNIKDIQVVRWHEDLPHNAKERIKKLWPIVGHLMCDNYEEWEVGFCHDFHFLKEIACWERIALAWRLFCRRFPKPAAINPKQLCAILAVATTGADVSAKRCGKELRKCWEEIHDLLKKAAEEMP